MKPDDAFARNHSFLDTVSASLRRSYGDTPYVPPPRNTLDEVTEVCCKAEHDFFYAGGVPSQCQRTLYLGQMEWRGLQRDLAREEFRYAQELTQQTNLFRGFTVHILTEESHLRAYVTSTKP